MRVLHLLLDLLEHLLHPPQLEGSRGGVGDGAKPRPRSSCAHRARAEHPKQIGVAKSCGGGNLWMHLQTLLVAAAATGMLQGGWLLCQLWGWRERGQGFGGSGHPTLTSSSFSRMSFSVSTSGTGGITGMGKSVPLSRVSLLWAERGGEAAAPALPGTFPHGCHNPCRSPAKPHGHHQSGIFQAREM